MPRGNEMKFFIAFIMMFADLHAFMCSAHCGCCRHPSCPGRAVSFPGTTLTRGPCGLSLRIRVMNKTKQI